jgi:PEP-CTERM motif
LPTKGAMRRACLASIIFVLNWVCAASLCVSHAVAATITFSVNPTGGYLHSDPNDAETNPLIVDLDSLGISNGSTIGLQVIGGFKFSFSDSFPDTATALGGVFSSSNVILPPTNLNRVPGAIGIGIDFVTGPTLFNGDPTDIPEDFSISPNGNLIAVPTGAKFLFAGVIDSFYADNSDPNGDFGLKITTSAVPEPSSTAMLLLLGLTAIMGVKLRLRRPA